MPNWVSTRLQVHGPENEVKAFVDACAITDDEGRQGHRIIPVLIPVPEELHITSTLAHAEIPEKWNEWVADGTWTQENYDQRVAENKELYEAQLRNIAKYGYKDWYEWQYATWGTKWGDCHTHFEGYEADGTLAKFRFDTPWSNAEGAWLTISTMFPKLRFVFTYDEEAGFFAGMEVYSNGKVVFESMFAPCDDFTYEGEVTEESYEDEWLALQDWKSDRFDQCWNEYKAWNEEQMV